VKKLSFDFGSGKSFVTALLLATAFGAQAAPAPLGMEIGVATTADLSAEHPTARNLGDTFLGGPAFLLGEDESGRFQATEFAFDDAGKLAMVSIQVYHDHWDTVLAGLRAKYKRSNYVMQRHDARGGKVYLAPHMDGVGASQLFEDVFQEGDTIIHAHGLRKQISYFTLSAHPKLAEAAAKARAARVEKAAQGL